ncbi:ATP-dependent RNA helicase [Malassezia arunalokei]|uniref:ATP-dependent RNA helicase n=1 Tax=Malassezia arunalokei TaxID=1514897 RepID=A0AAJ5YZZ3_9BASI|nr:ATP-dependent RNA helicase [Malassezia arunalokei]
MDDLEKEIDEMYVNDANEYAEDDAEPVAEHACAYCGLDDVDCVMKCTACDKWFCNGFGKTTSSHIVTHLVRARHKSVMLHPSSPLGDTVPECYSCGSRNPFLLGFLPAKGDAVVMLLCRSPCNFAANTKDMGWDATQWSPLIENRTFLSWLVKIPSVKQQKKARPITAQQILLLEELWRDNERATLADVENPEHEQTLPETLHHYETAKQYVLIHQKLISAEEDYDKRLKENLTQRDITVNWETSNGKTLVWIRLPQLESGEIRLAMGDELKLIYTGSLAQKWESPITVARFSSVSSTEVACEVPHGNKAPLHCTTNFNLEFIWTGTTYSRMNRALNRFSKSKSCMAPVIRDVLLGKSVDIPLINTQKTLSLSVPGLPELNHSQLSAIKAVLGSPISLIQGPPGTVMESSVSFLSLHEQASSVEPNSQLGHLIQLKHKNGGLNSSDEAKYRTLLENREYELLNAAEVICTTCSSSADKRLNAFKFPLVLIDEATQATEPECLIPIVQGCQQLVLVGDHQQLGPVVMNRKVARAGLNESLFERLVLLGVKPRRLEVQYRMHPSLSEFPSNMFYDGMLQNGVSSHERLRKHVAIPWPIPTMPMMFYQNLGQEEISPSGTSYLNRTEASSVEKLVTTLLKAGVAPEQIGVITPYEGQRNFVINHMQFHGSMVKDAYRAIEVASVDAFQGREKDYIIVTCVRSNARLGIGFLSDSRRLNVALTRARFGLIVIGNARVLCKDPLWYHFLVHFKDRNLLVEGALSNLRPSMIQFGPPPVPRKSKSRLEHTKTNAAIGTESLAMDPVRAPFRGAAGTTQTLREGMWDTLSLDAKTLSQSQSDWLNQVRQDKDADLESLDGYRSQASIAGSYEDEVQAEKNVSSAQGTSSAPSITKFL